MDPNLSGVLQSSKDVPWIYIVAIITGLGIVLAGLLLTVFLRDTPGNERFGFRFGKAFEVKVSSKFAGTMIALCGVWLCVSGLKTARPSVTYRGADHFDVANREELPSSLGSSYWAAKQTSTSDQVAALFDNLKAVGVETANGKKPVTIEFPVTEKRMVSGVLLPSSAAPVLKKEKYGFVKLPANSVSGRKPKNSEQLLFVPTFQFASGCPQELHAARWIRCIAKRCAFAHQRGRIAPAVSHSARKHGDDRRGAALQSVDHGADLLERKKSGDIELHALVRKLAHERERGLSLGVAVRDFHVHAFVASVPGRDLKRLTLHLRQVVGEDLKRNGFSVELREHVFAKRGVVGDAAFSHERGIGRKTLDLGIGRCFEHRSALGSIQKEFDAALVRGLGLGRHAAQSS